MRGLQITSVGCWFWFVGLNASRATLGLSTTTMLDGKHFESVSGGSNYHQCSVGVRFVGLCEPHASLAL